jgi:hypothetical protein
MWRGLEVERALRESGDARQDLVSGLRPDEQRGILLMRVKSDHAATQYSRITAFRLWHVPSHRVPSDLVDRTCAPGLRIRYALGGSWRNY